MGSVGCKPKNQTRKGERDNEKGKNGNKDGKRYES